MIEPYPPAAGSLLQGCLLLQPFIEIFLRHHVQVRLHVVVSQATKLSTHDFVASDLSGSEMNGEIEPGHEVLLYAQLAHEERVSYVLGVHQQIDLSNRDHGPGRGQRNFPWLR